MWLYSLLWGTVLASTTLAAVLGDSTGFTSTDTLERHRRGLDGYGLDGFLPVNGLQGTTTTQATTHTGDTATNLITYATFAMTTPPSSLTSSTPSIATGDIKKKTKETTSTPTSTPTSNLPPLETHSAAASPTTPPVNNTSAAASAAVSGAGATESTGTSEWKIIGVAVIAFSTVAAILLLSVFFDQWWHFVRDVFWRGRKGGDLDDHELVPDWEKAEWELRCGHDRQRYPSFTSLPSSLPSVPIIPAVQPPQAAMGKWGNAEGLGRAPVRPLDGTLGVGASLGSRLSSSGAGAGIAGVGVGLGIGRDSDGRTVSPRVGATAITSPRPQHTPRLGQGYTNQGGNPFDDSNANSPMPDDVYVGVEH